MFNTRFPEFVFMLYFLRKQSPGGRENQRIQAAQFKNHDYLYESSVFKSGRWKKRGVSGGCGRTEFALAGFLVRERT